MDLLPPIFADAFDLLRNDLYCYLDAAELLADKIDRSPDDDVYAAGLLIPDLVSVIRRVLGEHQGPPGGECQACRSEWPCPAVTTIHALLSDPRSEFAVLVGRASRPSEDE